jgi:hypothetical protein
MKNNYFFVILFTLFQFLKSNAQKFTPSIRHLHTTNLIKEKLYISGGTLYGNVSNRDDGIINSIDYASGDVFFYLDVSVHFNTQNLTWLPLLKDIENAPSHNGATAAIGGKNKDTIFIIDVNSDVYSYNTNENKWVKPTISGVKPVGRRDMIAVADKKGKIYLTGGYTKEPLKYYDSMNILDTENLSWNVGEMIGYLILDYHVIRYAPASYGATLLPDGKIIYLGGREESITKISNTSKVFDFEKVFLYDTKNDYWTVQFTQPRNKRDNIPKGRWGFSSVLGLDNKRIIIYGGSYEVYVDGGIKDDNPPIVVLEIKNFEWYQPTISGSIPTITRIQHTATVVGIYMIVLFGKNNKKPFDIPDYKLYGDSDVLFLNISDNENFIWTTSFEPPKKKNIPFIVGVSVGPTIGFIILIIFIIWYKKTEGKPCKNNICLL